MNHFYVYLDIMEQSITDSWFILNSELWEFKYCAFIYSWGAFIGEIIVSKHYYYGIYNMQYCIVSKVLLYHLILLCILCFLFLHPL